MLRRISEAVAGVVKRLEHSPTFLGRTRLLYSAH